MHKTNLDNGTPTPQCCFRHPLAIVDLETTGLNSSADRIIEIAIITTDQYLNIENKWSSLINPRRHVTGTQIHGITDQDVAQAPVFAEVLPVVEKMLRNRIIVAHNAKFDLSFLKSAFSQVKKESLIENSLAICTMNQSYLYCQPGSHSLAGLTERIPLHITPSHRALQDANACFALLQHFVEQEINHERFQHVARDRFGNTIYPSELLIEAATGN